MIVHSPIAACDDCGAPENAWCDTSCPSARANRAASALESEDSAPAPCCSDPWCPCRTEQPLPVSVYELQRRCEHCGVLVPTHAAIRCGDHTQCALCAIDGFCGECKALVMEELQARADDHAYERQESLR